MVAVTVFSPSRRGPASAVNTGALPSSLTLRHPVPALSETAIVRRAGFTTFSATVRLSVSPSS
jgi:hypothetical protein